jgi:AcrR family transcriptional regulator
MSSVVSRGTTATARAVEPTTERTRRHLTARQARTVQKLTEATVEELRSVGYEGLTVRNVARRAGVAPATAYTYFASREHLVTEVFWRRLAELPETTHDGRRSPVERASATLGDVALLVADEPRLAAACTVAMLASDPDVKHLRDRIGLEVHRRIRDALGDGAADVEVTTIELAVFGALVQAGTGHLRYEDLPTLLAEVVAQVVGAHR